MLSSSGNCGNLVMCGNCMIVQVKYRSRSFLNKYLNYSHYEAQEKKY